MSLEIVVTTAGRAALVNAENTGTDPVTITQVGLTQLGFAAGAGALALPDEFKRIAGVGGQVVADDIIHVSALDESDDAYSLRGFALYLADGTLFALYGQADPILVKTAGSIGGLIADVVFADIDAALLTFGNTDFTNPPATEEALGVVEFADGAEAAAGLVGNRALSPSRAKAAVLAWLLAQDGAGSLLDADKLDGQEGAYYANIPARLGFTPLNAAFYTAADVLAKLLGVDGAGSNLDADLLDGQEGAYYANIPARLGYTPLDLAAFTGAAVVSRLGYVPLDQAAFTAAAVITRLLTVDGAGSTLDADLLDGQEGAYYANIPARLGFTPLNAATFTAAEILARLVTVDGSGSGIDADLLDGKNATAFVEQSQYTGANQLLAPNGYQKHPGGLIEQWGEEFVAGPEGTYSAAFPIPFPNACFAPVGIIKAGTDMWLQLQSYDRFGVTFRYQSTGGNVGAGFTWQAKGY